MKKIIVILCALVAFSVAASANNYSVDEASIDALFTEAAAEAPAAPANAALIADSQTCNIVALVVDWVGFGVIGLHRIILGTNPLNMLWYFLTIGGIFGILPLVDGIMLIVDLVNNSASYINNPAFIMWI